MQKSYTRRDDKNFVRVDVGATWSTQTGREWETSAGPFVHVFFRKTNPAHLERYVAWLVVQAVRRISPSSDARRELWKVSLGFRVWMHFSSERGEDARMHFQGDRERQSPSPSFVRTFAHKFQRHWLWYKLYERAIILTQDRWARGVTFDAFPLELGSNIVFNCSVLLERLYS